jgi:signal transduction histidine kinase/DNA-binding response OmpR family regulator/PAS domain-containing protein
MKKLKGLIDRYVFSDEFTLDVRLMNMVCIAGMASCLFATFTRVLINPNIIIALVMLSITLSVALLMYLCNRFHLYTLGIWVTLVVLGDILFPAAFFIIGGADSGMAAYFVVSISAIFILTSGKKFAVLLSSHLVWIIICYSFALHLADLIPVMTPVQQTMDNLQSLIVSGFFVGLIIKFQHRNHILEKQKSDVAANALMREQQTSLVIFGSNPHINILFDDHFQVIDANDAAVKFFGFPDKKALMFGFFARVADYIPPAQPSGRISVPLAQRLQTAVEKGGVQFETELHVQGRKYIMDVVCKCIPYQTTFAVVGYLVDMTSLYAMHDDLSRQDELLRVVNNVAAMLLTWDVHTFEHTIQQAMEMIARVMNIDRMYIWKNSVQDGVLHYTQAYEWVSDDSLRQETLMTFPYRDTFPGWERTLLDGASISGPLSRFPEIEGQLSPYKILSILLIPVFMDNKLWGFVSLDDCHNEREFSEEEKNILSSGSLLMVNALLRNENEKDIFKRIEQEALMSTISQSFVSKEPMPNLINSALRKIGKFLRVARVLVIEADKNSAEHQLLYSWVAADRWKLYSDKVIFNDIVNTTFPEDLPEAGYVPVVSCSDVYTEADGKYKIFEHIDVKSFVWVPLYVDAKYWGVLSIEACENKRVWNESDMRLIGTLGSAVSGTLSLNLVEKRRLDALEQAIQANNAKSNFLSNMSHEMRTPMNAIVGMTSIGKSAADIGKKDYAFEKIEEASTHLLGVINDVLDMSKIETNMMELLSVDFDFEKMLQRVMNIIKFMADEKRQDFRLRVDMDIPRRLVGDDQRLAQVITNLLSNAVKFTPEYGLIYLDTHLVREENGVCTIQIQVTDTGIGISREQQAHLFNPFQQADSSTSRNFGGTGLGLAISKRIVEMMNGEIWVESELGQGSTFTFTIQAKWGETERYGPLNGGANWDSMCALVVDDQPEILKYLQEIAHHLGIGCAVAASGQEALARDQSYDIYFIDWQMPDIDGIELAKRIKERNLHSSVVLMRSTMAGNEIGDEAKTAGVDKFLSGPLFPSAIADCINACLGMDSLPQEEKRSDRTPDSFAGRRVLLVEDMEINREIVLALLEPTQLAIDCAKNGAEAVKIFNASPERYDMIFMDLQMPEMDGYEATRLIRQMDDVSAKAIPIVAMTANIFREDIEKCLAVGMNDHVGKPLDLDEVLRKLHQYLPKKHQDAEKQ